MIRYTIVISSKEHAWYNMIRAGNQWDSAQLVNQDVYKYNIIIIKLKI